MDRYPDGISESELRNKLKWQLHLAFGDPDSTERKALVKLIRQNLPPIERHQDNIVSSLVNECVDMIWKNILSGDPTWDPFGEPGLKTKCRVETMMKNSLFDALSTDHLRRENIPSLARQFGDILRQKLLSSEFTEEDCPHEEYISSLIHQCADTTPQNSQSSESAGVRVYERNKPSVGLIDAILSSSPSFGEPDLKTKCRVETMMKNSLFDALPTDHLRRENIPSLARQFGDISSLIHQCADTTPQNSQSRESAGVRVYERNKPSVVRIDAIRRRVDASTLDVLEVPQELGSGIVLDKCGHILTNDHVIRSGLRIHSHVRVTLADQSTYVAKVVFVDPDNDVAVLRINAPKHKLIPIRFGNSADLRVGEKVYAFGNPFGFNHSLTKGVISALHREINSLNTGCPMQDMIQTDAAINPGNSGGALLDRFGNFIGMNTSISSRCRESCGVGFAIPVDKLRRIFYDYMKQNVGTNLAPDQFVEQVGVSGVPVLDAPVKSPASNVGLEVIKQKIMALLGDIVTFMKETKVPNQSDLYSTLGHCKMGVKMFPGMEQHGSEILLARDVCAS